MAIQLGIIGFGGMAGFHAKNAVKVPGVKVVAAYDIDPVRVEAARSEGLRGADTLEALLSDPEVNTVLVATPNDVHKELCIAALKAGKNVICEKPVTLCVADLDEMIQAAKDNGKLFTVHQNRRWDKDFLTAKAVMKEGTLGKVYSIQSRLHGSGGQIHGWRQNKAQGGGMLFDWGVHFLDQLLSLYDFELPESVYCRMDSVINPDVDDYFMMLLRMKDGVQIVIEIGTYVLHYLPRWFVLGDKATLHIDDFSAEGAVTRVKSLQDDATKIIMTSAGPTRTFAPRPKDTKEELPLPNVEGDWKDFYANVDAAIQGKAELIVQPWQVRRVMQVIDAGFESAQKGEVVRL